MRHRIEDQSQESQQKLNDNRGYNACQSPCFTPIKIVTPAAALEGRWWHLSVTHGASER